MTILDITRNKTYQILEKAEIGGYGIAAVTCYNLEGILATVRAAEQKRSPAIIQLFPWSITLAQGRSTVVDLAASATRTAKVPISVHFDHCLDVDMVRAAIHMPFDSIMIDMSHHEKEENLRLTAELVKEAHEKGIAVEAEPGRIEGGEDGLADTADLDGLLTDEEEALAFEKTGIQFLAPAFGNLHGLYGKRGIHLDFDRLERIRKALGGRTRIVLHGTNDFPDDIMKRCILGGVTKVNLNKLIMDKYTEHVNCKTGKMEYSKLMEGGIDAYQELIEHQMDVLGSTGKA